jgi:LPS-assembly protein
MIIKPPINRVDTLIISLRSFALKFKKDCQFICLLCAITLPVLAESTSENNTELPLSLALCQSSEKTDSEVLSSSVKLPAMSEEDKQALDEGSMLLHAKGVNYIPDEKLELSGDVEVQHGIYHAYSDKAIIDQASQKAELTGNIVLGSPDLKFQGSSATLNVTNNEVRIENAKFINTQTGVNGEAKTLSRPDDNILIIHEGLFSSCPPEDRDWAFASDKITLNREEGFGQAKHTRFLIKDIPVLYIPWFSFPIDDRRKSGFLYPTVGSSNTESGIFLSIPYYLNLAENYDTTVTPTYIGGRGIHYDIEGRHKSIYTDSLLMLSYIDKDDYFDSEQELLNRSDDPTRWGLSFDQDIHPFADGWSGQLKFSEVSDNNYLEDLNQGLNIDRTDNLDRRAEFSYDREDWRFSFLLQQYKSIDDQILPSEQAYQRLPELYFDVGQVYNRFQFDWSSRYVYFYRDRENLVGDERIFGSRLRHQAKVSFPFNQPWGYVKPAMILDQTDYILQDFTPLDNHVSRTIPFYELDTGLYFDRKTQFKGGNFRQSLEPRAYYVYSNFVDQDDLPNFDTTLPSFSFQRLFNAHRFSGGDRVGDNNRLTLGLTSRWTDLSNGIDRAVISLGQIFHYRDREVNIDGVGSSDNSSSLVASELLLRPIDGVEIGMSGLWDTQEKQTQEGNSNIQFHSQYYRYVMNFSHRYIRDELEQVDSSFITPLYKEMSLIGRWRYDMDNNRTIGTLAGVEYGSCCWRVQFLTQSYLNSKDEVLHGVLFRFQLNGVGGFGQSASRMDQHIPGYAAREQRFK